MASSFKGAHFPQEIILLGVRWYLAYPLSYRQVEELRAERGVDVDHATRQRWVVQDRAQLAAAFHRRKRSVCRRGRMDETDRKVKGQWRYLSRAVATHGQTIDFVLTEPRDKEAALRFLKQAIRRHGVPETITIDGSDAKEAAIQRDNAAHGTASAIRQGQSCTNLVAQEHRGVKRVTRPRLGCQSLTAAQDPLVGIELRPMIKTRQLGVEEGDEGHTAAALCYSLAASSLPPTGVSAPSRPPEQNLRHNPHDHRRVGDGDADKDRAQGVLYVCGVPRLQQGAPSPGGRRYQGVPRRA